MVLGPAAPSVRRTVGPSAWIVLEHLAATATECDDTTVSHESVRGLAEALGLAKDTVARALRRHIEAGLVTHVTVRAPDGRFGRSHYRLTFPAELFLDLPRPRQPVEPTRPARPRRHPEPSTVAQLTLMDTGAIGR